MAVLIPDKLFFKIGEVAHITSLRPSVLRYWETEFELLNPVKSRSGQRLYTRKELDVILEIKKLLYSEKLTIEGARKKLKVKGKQKEPILEDVVADTDNIVKVLRETKEALKKIRDSL